MRVRHHHRHRHRRVWKALGWSALVLVLSLAGGLGYAYYYVTDSATLAGLVRAEGPRYLPGSVVELGHAKLRPFTGEVQLTNVTVRQPVDGAQVLTLRVPWLRVRHDPRALLKGRFEPSEVVVAQPTLRVRRRKDGTWNLQGLLASPWPGPVSKTPPVQIQNGTVELSDGPPGTPPAAVLRDVSVRVESQGVGWLKFEGSARGDSFDRVNVSGTLEVATGRLELRGDVARLALNDTLRGRVPPEYAPAFAKLGLTGGEADVRVNRLRFDPAGATKLRYDVDGVLRAGVWNCPKLPFPLNDVSAGFAARDGVIAFDHAEGHYGTTAVRVSHAEFSALDPKRLPMSADLEVSDLELDARLRDWTPAEFRPVWSGFRPSGRLSLAVSVGRGEAGGPLRHRVVADCQDVAILYEHFKYPLDHLRGRLVWEGDRLDVIGVRTTAVGGRPLTANGVVLKPGPAAVVELSFTAESLPVDKALMDALPADVREVVDHFHPTGTVRGVLGLRRTPPAGPGDDPRGKVAIDATVDLNEHCAMTWDDMPYPVTNLTGRLKLHPDLWEFEGMRGGNGQAVLTGSGRVQKLPGPRNPLKVDLHLNAEKLPFDDQLRGALPQAWRKTWEILDPTGSCDVEATIAVDPSAADKSVLKIVPRPATGVRLHYSRSPRPGVDPGGTFELRMEDVSGLFVFENGPVQMKDVGFRFHGAPVRFADGRVTVEDTGRFDLRVRDLWVKEIRLDNRLRQTMPPVMAQFAQRLDDGRTFTLKGDLGIGWSGKPGANAYCRWDKTLVVFNDNAVTVQPGLALEHIQGQLDGVHGYTDGDAFEVGGALRLESVALLGQQLTRLETPIVVKDGVLRLPSLRGGILGGEVTGGMSVSLEPTPRYAAGLAVRGADLQQYARTLPGRQTFRGTVDARLDLNGFGGELRTLQGRGEAHVTRGDLGELPVALRLFKFLQLSPVTKTAFDSADVALVVQNGETYFDPIRFTGDAFSLHGRGTMDVQGDLDLRLRVLLGRDSLHVRPIRGALDILREASGKLLVVRVQGTPASPSFRLDPLPDIADGLKTIGQNRSERAAERRPK